jgi:membrane fusion protein (multidrug efflux system)
MREGMQRGLFVMGLMLVLAACSRGNGNDWSGRNEEEQLVRMPVEVSEVSLGAAESAYRATGTLTAEQQATVVARTSGVLLDVLAEEGDRVNAGDVLARLDDDRLQLEVQRAKASLGQARADAERARELAERDLGSDEQYEQARSTLATQQANYDLAVLEASYAQIQAPFDGVISQRNVKAGNLIQLNQELFTMHQTTPLRVEIFVPETRLVGLREGAPVRMRVDALAGQVFNGELERISPVIDADSGTVRLTVMFDNDSDQLRPGMFGRVDVVQEQRDGVRMLPRTAIVRRDDEQWVFVVRDGKAVRVPVALGLEERDRVEILEGPEVGEMLITAGQNSVTDGAEVEVINLPEAETPAAAEQEA